MDASNHTDHARRPGTLFGVPLGDLGWFQSLLMGLATGFIAFFLATFASIIGLLFYSGTTHHAVDFAMAYKRIGLPVGLVAGIAALSYLGYLWMHRVLTRGRNRS